MVVAGDAVAHAEQQAEMLVDVAGTAEIERGKSTIIIRVLALRKQFATECQVRPEIAL